MTPRSSKSGAVLLITVIILGSLVLLVGLQTALSGVSELSMGYGENQSFETRAVTDACAEEGLLRLSMNYAYTGSTLSMGDGTCTIGVTEDGEERILSVAATIDYWTRSSRLRVLRSKNRITIRSWRYNN